MTTSEHLRKIKAKCEELLRSPSYSQLTRAGWKSTIAAIEFLERTEMYSTTMACEIIYAWQEELL